MSQSEAAARSQKVTLLREQGVNPYPSQSFDRTHTAKQIEELFSQPGNEIEKEKADPAQTPIVACGRIVSKRDSGSLIFLDLQDVTGKIQLLVNKSELLSQEGLTFKQVEKLVDEGDFVGVQGIGYRTKKGQLSILTKELNLLAKATIPFPDSYYGVNDPEICRRYREMDMASNSDTLRRFTLRSKITQGIRTYLCDAGFYEIETPILQSIYGGAAARPFVTHHNALGTDLYLRIAPELFLKRAICGGFERVFEIGRVFRNEGIDNTHNPEFTSLEAYQAYADYYDAIELIENIICFVIDSIGLEKDKIQYGDRIISFERQFDYSMKLPVLKGKHWCIKTMVEAVKDETGLDFDILDLSEALTAVEQLEIKLSSLQKQSLGYLLYAVFDKKVEETLIQPTFIIDFPVEVSPLAKRHRSKPQYTERFEMFIDGKEFSNCFSELNDPKEQKERFQEQLAQKEAGDDEAHPMDTDFIQALSLGLPTCAGMSIGIDRLVMLLTNSKSIRDAIMFPTMRTIKE
jgi:lysyl-tRNA synthetase, class II